MERISRPKGSIPEAEHRQETQKSAHHHDHTEDHPQQRMTGHGHAPAEEIDGLKGNLHVSAPTYRDQLWRYSP